MPSIMTIGTQGHFWTIPERLIVNRIICIGTQGHFLSFYVDPSLIPLSAFFVAQESLAGIFTIEESLAGYFIEFESLEGVWTDMAVGEKVDLSIHRGDSRTYDVSITDQNGAVLSLVGAKVWFTVKEKDTDSDAAAKIQLVSSSSSQIEIYDAAGGKCYVKVKNTHTQDLPPGAYVYDVQVLRSNGDIGTVLWGAFTLQGDVTRAVA